MVINQILGTTMEIEHSTYGRDEIKKLLIFCATQIEKWQIPNELEKVLNNISWSKPSAEDHTTNQQHYVFSDRFNFLQQIRIELENNVLLFIDQEAKFKEIDEWAINSMKKKVYTDVQVLDYKRLLAQKNYMSDTEFASWQFPNWSKEEFLQDKSNFKHSNAEGIRFTVEKGLHCFPYFNIKKNEEIRARLLPLQYFRLVVDEAIQAIPLKGDLNKQILLWKKAKSDLKRIKDNEINYYADNSFLEYFDISQLLNEIDNRIENLVLSLQLKIDNTPIAKVSDNKEKPSLFAIAIFHRITGKSISKHNANKIANDYGWSSGRKLLENYTKTAHEDDLFFISPDSKQSANWQVKYFKEASTLAKTEDEKHSMHIALSRIEKNYRLKY